jgi:2-hydroxychromene-2-carboxylate isomerase
MQSAVEVYWSFRSPYSYLATPGMLALREQFAVEVNLRPVLPIALRAPNFFSPENMLKIRYILTDWPRRAQFLGMAHEWPSPDPIVQDLATYKIADEQPYIYRLTMLGVEAQRQGKGIDFAAQVAALLFGGTKQWDEGEHLALAAARAGLDLAHMEAEIAEGSHREEIDKNQTSLEAAGHTGVPTFVFDGEPFFGQDRIGTLMWRLDQHALRR